MAMEERPLVEPKTEQRTDALGEVFGWPVRTRCSLGTTARLEVFAHPWATFPDGREGELP